MARYPTVGAVKTRLGRVIGGERACALYRAFLQDIEARFAAGRRTLVWVFYPPEADFAAVTSSAARRLPQAGHALGERMWNCFRTLCGEGFEQVIMIGADVPHVRAEWLDEAEARLAVADVILGPSDDGGYYLVAMRQPHDIFTGIEMSTDSVLTETLHRAQAAGLCVHLLPRSFDIDEVPDLRRLHSLLADNSQGVELPRTAAVLAGLLDECGWE